MEFKKKFASLKKDFDMNTVNPCVFYHSQWDSCTEGEHVSIPYLIYRFLFMTILVSSITFSTLCQSYLFHIFLTNWSFTLQTLYGILFSFNIAWKKCDYFGYLFRQKFCQVYTEPNVKSYELKDATSWVNATDEDGGKDKCCVNILDEKSNNLVIEEQGISPTTVLTADSSLRKPDTAAVTVVNSNNNNTTSDVPSVLEKVILILMNISHVLPHIVAFGYWVFVYKYDPDQAACERFRSHFIVHGATSLLAILDALIVSVPVRRTHFLFPSTVLLLYGFFSYIYEQVGGPYRNGKEFIYSILNWKYRPQRTVLLVGLGVMFSPVIHLITCWGIQHLRVKLSGYCKRIGKYN